VTLAIYVMSLPYPFVWDDEEQIVNNPAVQNLSAILAIFMGSTFASHGASGLGGHYFKPMMPLSFNLLWHLGFGQPGLFHLFQIVVHAVNGMLLWRLMYGLVKHGGRYMESRSGGHIDRSEAKSRNLSRNKAELKMKKSRKVIKDASIHQDDRLLRLSLLFASLLFIIHPLQVEAVVYIAALQEPLFSLFGLLALNTVVLPWRRMIKWKEWHYLCVVTGLLLLSMLSKETGGLFVVVALGWYLWKAKQNHLIPDGESKHKSLTDNQLVNRLFGISVALGAVYAGMRFLLARVPLSSHGPSPIMMADWMTRLQTMPAVMWFYFQKLIWPDKLFIAQHWLVEEISLSNFGIPLVGLVAIFVLSNLILYSLNKCRSKLLPLYATGYAIIWLNVIFHSQLFPLDLTVAERWGYMWLMGVSMWLASGVLWLAAWLAERNEVMDDKRTQLTSSGGDLRLRYAALGRGNIVILVLFIFLLLLTTRTLYRIPTWSSELRLYEHDVALNPEAFDLQNNYGVALYRRPW